MAKIMGKYFFCRDSCGLAQTLHLRPDIWPVHGSSAAGDENRSAFDFLFSAIALQSLTELFCDQDDAEFSFAPYLWSAGPERFHRNKWQLWYSYSRSRDRLQDIIESLISLFLRGLEQTKVFLFGKFFIFIAENALCILSGRTLHSSQPTNRKNPLTAVSMELIVTTAYSDRIRYSFQAVRLSFAASRGRVFSGRNWKNAFRSLRYFSIVPWLRSSCFSQLLNASISFCVISFFMTKILSFVADGNSRSLGVNSTYIWILELTLGTYDGL